MKPYPEHGVPSTKYPVLLFFLVFSAFSSLARADVVYDSAGGTMKGLVVEEHRDRIVVSTEQGEKTLFRDQIEEVFYAEPERNYLYLGNQALEQQDFGIARGFFTKALQINPDLSEAADALERTADQEKKQAFEPAAVDPPAALKKQWGMKLEAGTPFVTVSAVQPGSPAERAGLQPGDGLAASWSSSLAFLPLAEVAKELTGPPGSRIKLTVHRRVNLPGRSAAQVKLAMERLGLTVALPAGPAPLLPGDRIVSMDGKPTRYLPLRQASKRAQAAGVKGADLMIQRDVFVTRE